MVPMYTGLHLSQVPIVHSEDLHCTIGSVHCEIDEEVMVMSERFFFPYTKTK